MPSLIATMTGNAAPAPYVASASGVYATSDPYLAFTKSTSDYWMPGSSGTTTGWLQIDLGTAETADTYQLHPGTFANRAPKTWTVQGSTDGAAWTVVDTRTDVAWPSATTQTFTVATPGAYRFYRLNVTANNGGSYLNVAEWDLIGAPAAPTVTLTGTAPSVTGTFDAAVVTPLISGDLTGNAPKVTGSIALEQTGVGIADLAGVSPGVFGTFEATASAGAIEVATDAINRLHGMTLVTEWQVVVEPPVTEPKRQRAHDYAIAVSITNPTLVDGRPT